VWRRPNAQANALSVDRSYHSVKEEPDVVGLVSLDADDYPAIRYWYRDQYRDEKRRWDESDTEGSVPGVQALQTKNESFWFLQNADGTTIDNAAVNALRAEAKLIWTKMCDDYGPIGHPWSSVARKRRQEYFAKLEGMFFLLRLCADHYKANVVATSDYKRWYKERYPNASSKRKRGRSNKMTSRKTQRRRTSSRRVIQTLSAHDSDDMDVVEETSAQQDDEHNDDDEDDEMEDDDEEEDEVEVNDDETEDEEEDELVGAEDRGEHSNGDNDFGVNVEKVSRDDEEVVQDEEAPAPRRRAFVWEGFESRYDHGQRADVGRGMYN
jgi:hypothetical protein